MADACDPCLIAQVGFQPQASYPYSTAVETPENVYCVSGVPVVPPYKGIVGPGVGSASWSGVTLAAALSTNLELSPTFLSPLSWGNDTVRSVKVIVDLDGYYSVSPDSGYTLSFLWGADVRISSPATVDAAFESHGGISSTSYAYSATLAMTRVYDVDPGGVITVTPRLYYTTNGGAGLQTVLNEARISALLWGGAT